MMGMSRAFLATDALVGIEVEGHECPPRESDHRDPPEHPDEYVLEDVHGPQRHHEQPSERRHEGGVVHRSGVGPRGW